MSAKSWPAEKTGPFAAKNTPRALLSPTLRKASVSSSICLSERAFRRFGLFIVIVAKSPSYCSSISSYGFCSSIDIGWVPFQVLPLIAEGWNSRDIRTFCSEKLINNILVNLIIAQYAENRCFFVPRSFSLFGVGWGRHSVTFEKPW